MSPGGVHCQSGSGLSLVLQKQELNFHSGLFTEGCFHLTQLYMDHSGWQLRQLCEMVATVLLCIQKLVFLNYACPVGC